MRFLSSIGCLLLLLSASLTLHSQTIKPGFEWEEAAEMLRITAHYGDSAYIANNPKPERFQFVYQSPAMGLDNMWELWWDQQETIVINVRGSTTEMVSWLANLYLAMAPAKGEITREGQAPFVYKLAENPLAAIHSGWLISLSYLGPDILPKLDSCYQKGVRNLLITGHSQGGAISYLLTAYLYDLQSVGKFPADFRIKTYCMAAPKPGNLYFAYDYEAKTRDGWAYNVVNAADWVPESPVSIQKLDDFNPTNPFVGFDALVKQQKFPVNLVLKRLYKKLDKPSQKAAKRYEKALGSLIGKRIEKALPDLTLPPTYPSINYVRTGIPFVLNPDTGYYKLFLDTGDYPFIHHLHPAYWYLMNAAKPGQDAVGALPIENQPNLDNQETSPAGQTENNPVGNLAAQSRFKGNWELRYLAGIQVPFEELYPKRKPTMFLRTQTSSVNGYSGCNSYNGTFELKENALVFSKSFAMTRMACEGFCEGMFIQALQNVQSYWFVEQNSVLRLLDSEGETLLEFIRIP